MAEVRTLGVVLGNGRELVADRHSPMLLPVEQVLGERTIETRRLFRAWILFAAVLMSLSALFVIRQSAIHLASRASRSLQLARGESSITLFRTAYFASVLHLRNYFAQKCKGKI